VWTPAGEIPSPEPFEIAELARALKAAARAARFAEEVEVMADEEHHAIAHQTFEEVSANLVVIASVDRFAHVVEERGGPELAIFGRVARVLEDLERMEERVALGMIARRLGHAIEVVQELEEFGFHLPYRAPTPTVAGYRWVVRYRTVKVLALTSGVALIAIATLLLANQRPQPTGAIVLSGAVGIVVGYGIILAAQLARRRAYQRAQRADDVIALRQAFDRLAEMYEDDHRPRVRAMVALHEAAVLAHEHRWSEAASCLERVDVSLFPASEARASVPVRAFVIAHVGNEATALQLLDEAAAGATAEDQRRILGTRGIVLQRLGRNEEAHEALSNAAREQGRPATLLFYRGEAERALGRIDDAVASYEEVLAIPGDSGWHRGAREALIALKRPTPFR